MDRSTQRILLLRRQFEFHDASAGCPNTAGRSASKRLPTETRQVLQLGMSLGRWMVGLYRRQSKRQKLEAGLLSGKNPAYHVQSSPPGLFKFRWTVSRHSFMCFAATEGERFLTSRVT